MENYLEVIKGNAKTLYVSSSETSWGVFCYGENGDFFLNSDWGFLCFAWRSYGSDFETFLKSLNAEYIYGKFETNWNQWCSPKIKGRRKEQLIKLIELFLTELKKQ